MDIGNVLTNGGILLVELVVAIVGAVWVVGKISGTTDKLHASIEHLTKSVDGLTTWIRVVDERSDEHGERITRVETRLDSFHDPRDRRKGNP